MPNFETSPPDSAQRPLPEVARRARTPKRGATGQVARGAADLGHVELLVQALVAADLEPRGLLTYHFPHREAWSQESSVFVCRTWIGEPAASDELDPEWFDLAAVPLDEMWDDASRWLPDVLAGGSVRRTFVFGADLATVVEERRPVA